MPVFILSRPNSPASVVLLMVKVNMKLESGFSGLPGVTTKTAEVIIYNVLILGNVINCMEFGISCQNFHIASNLKDERSLP